MAVVVVGAGIAGLSCARELIAGGLPARVIERDVVVGGRLASDDVDGRPVDVGAAYVTADDPAFQGRLQSWRIAGLARPWTSEFRGQHGDGPTRWSAPGGLRTLAEDLAKELDVTLGTEVTALPDAEAVVLAMPGPQALRIAPDLAAAAAQQWSPVRTVVLRYPERTWDDFHGMFVNEHPLVATICDDGDRRGDRAPVLVAHSTGDAAQAAPEEIAEAAGALLGVTARPSITVRDWPQAQPRPGREPFARDGHVYLCGDAFGRPRVQTAWLSGRAVARHLLQSRER